MKAPSVRCLPLALVLVLVLVSACGNRGEPDAGIPGPAPGRLLQLEHETPQLPRGAATPEDTLIAEFTCDGSSAPWTCDHPELAQQIQLDDERFATSLTGSDTVKLVRLQLPKRRRDFNIVEFVVMSRGTERPERVRASLGGHGINDGSFSRSNEISNSKELLAHTLQFRFAGHGTTGRGSNSIGLRLAGKHEETCLVAIRLLQRENELFFPSADEPAELIELGGIERRGVGLRSKASVVSRARVIEQGAALAFSVALPSVWDLSDQDVQLRLESQLLPSGAENVGVWEPVADWTLRAENRRDWQELRAPLDALAEQERSFRWSLDTVNDNIVYAVLAEARIVEPKDTPQAVLLITSDTHRADALGATAPDGWVATPHLDRLARRGTLFTNCMSPTNVTLPSHVSALTGLHPKDTGVVSNRMLATERASTLAEAFAASGFRTFASVSVHHLSPKASGLGQGFDRFDSPNLRYRDAAESVDQALAWMDTVPGEDVFLWVHVFDAHTPYGAPGPFGDRYLPTASNLGPVPASAEVPAEHLPSWAETTEGSTQERAVALYRGEVDYLDEQLGRLLAHDRIASGTVAFTADHGESLGENGIWYDHGELYPPTVRIPMIVASPELASGARCDQPVMLFDVGQALLRGAGLPDDPFPGRGMRWATEDDPANDPRFLMSSQGMCAAVEAEGHFFIMQLRSHSPNSSDRRFTLGQSELFDIKSDPRCTNDLLLDRLDQARRMRAALLGWLDRSENVSFAAKKSLTAVEAELLEQLGYGGDTSTASEWWNPAKLGPAWLKSPWRRLFEDEDYSVDQFRVDVVGR